MKEFPAETAAPVLLSEQIAKLFIHSQLVVRIHFKESVWDCQFNAELDVVGDNSCFFVQRVRGVD